MQGQQPHGVSGNGNNNACDPQQQQLSLDGLDMQRLQQQFQAAQQYRQQQYGSVVGGDGTGGGGGTTSLSSTSNVGGGMSMMQQSSQQQQQQHHHPGMNNPNAMANMMQPGSMGQHVNSNAMMPPSLHGMNHSNLPVGGVGHPMIGGGGMQQFPGGNNNAFMSGNWNNAGTTSQQMQQQSYNSSSDMYNNFEASGHPNQRLMTMSGLGAPGGNGNNPYGASAQPVGGMSGMMGQHLNDPNVNSVLVNTENSSTALQNMQLLLLKQQQQGLMNRHHSMHLEPQQSGRPAMLSGIPTTFNSSHQFSKSASSSSTPNNTIGLPPAGDGQHQQQMLLFQQHLATLQKQQQNPGVGGGSAVANAAMVAMQQSTMQQLAADGGSLYQQQQLPNSASALSVSAKLQQGVLHQQSLNARQQHIVQQMQQQHLNRSVNDKAAMDGSNTAFDMHSMQQSGTQPMLRPTTSPTPGMFNTVPPPHLQQQTSGMEQLNSATANSLSMMNSNIFQQPGMMGNQNNKINTPALNTHDQLFNIGQIPLNETDSEQPQSMASDQTPFLDGRFAGGWQSNADLPERRRIIFCILDVIRQMRPDTSKLSNKLPHMAKSLEEHLYRSAKSKEQYMDITTLKTRLQAIAHGLEVHRSTDTTSVSGMNPLDLSTGAESIDGDQSWSVATALRSSTGEKSGLSGLLAQTNPGDLPSTSNIHSGTFQEVNVQQQGAALSYSQGISNGNPDNEQDLNYLTRDQSTGTRGSSPSTSFLNGLDSNQELDLFSMQSNSTSRDVNKQNQSTDSWTHSSNTVPQVQNMDYPISSKFQDPTDAQKMRVILQQQQRLLLLRHASKCTAGLKCHTKFCEQMVTLWKHMKICRNKNCKTSHCLSSRCVLNHYRICKSNGRTLTCEVCGPVMLKIKNHERDYGTTDDPLTRDQGMEPSSSASVTSYPLASNEQSQLHMVQTKLKAQLDILKLLQKHQEQLLEQQKRLESQAQSISDPNSPEFLQLQEQQLLLQQLQKRCQQQQLLIQHEIELPTNSSEHEPSLQSKETEPILATSTEVIYPVEAKIPLQKHLGISGKRSGKSLVLPPLRKSKAKNSDSRSNSGSDRSPKKTKFASKQKAILSASLTKPASEGMEKKFEEDHVSQLSCMKAVEIRKHLDSLNKKIVLSSRTVTHKCLPILQELMDDQFGWVFHDAVDPVALGLPDYFDVIKNPMHMDLIRKKLENAIYPAMENFARDMRLVFQNSILYNGESSEVGELAQSMMSRFDELFSAVQADIEHSHLNLESQGELCSLCGLQKRRYEPTVLYCQGQCGMQRIKRNEPYFTDRTKLNHWCEPCFNLLDDYKHVLLDDGSEVTKQELQEFKNDALPEEGWVNCDSCHSWVHQVCALFNGRTNKSNARFTCPNCCIITPSTEESRDNAKKVVKGAEDLPRCKMSDVLEKGLSDSLNTAYKARSLELGVAFEDIEKAEGLCVRVLSNVEKKNIVGEKMLQRYQFKEYPSEFPLRSKCIALFQKIHGVDTLLFAMYVYEYGDDCPAPNRRHVYISYLDSVRYFEPKCYRTTAYHTVMVEYLRYVKKRGFHTASIWSCPPVNGDDYIFYCHPKHQLVPREDMLRAWYHKMLDQAKAQGIVLSTSTLYDEYFSSESDNSTSGYMLNPTCLPYFEGDYIPGELEIIIQQCEANGDNLSDSAKHDTVMARLGHNLLKMKDNFIVVHLRNRRFVEAVQRGEDVSHWKEDSDDDMVRSKRAKISAKSIPDNDIGKIQVNAVLSKEVNDFSSARGDTAISEEPKGRSTKEWNLSIDSVIPWNNNVASGNDEAAGKHVSNIEIRVIQQTEEDSNVDHVDVSKITHKVSSSVEQQVHDVCNSSNNKASDKEVVYNVDVTAGDVSSSTEVLVQDANNSSLSVAPLNNQAVVDPVGAVSSICDDALIAEPKNHDVSDSNDEIAKISDKAFVDPIEVAAIITSDIQVTPEMQDHIADNSHVTTIAEVVNIGNTESRKIVVNPSQLHQDISVHQNEVADGKEAVAAASAEHPTEDLLPMKKRALDELGPVITSHFIGMNRTNETVSDTADDDPLMESEMFESRQQFLNYCQSAHCQFDELRRAKHSTGMVLFQLHNPSAPKFLQQCGACYRDITHGIRYHCNNCSNFDLCEDCYEPIMAGTWAKRDPHFTHDKNHSFTTIDMESTDNTPNSQADRQNSLKAHVNLLEHAAFCDGLPSCSLHNCDRFKKIFLHCATCDIKPKRECKICTRMLVLCTMHSRLCNSRGSCTVPFCDRIREHNKRLYRQQQLMDDRRRQAQNELYHTGGDN